MITAVALLTVPSCKKDSTLIDQASIDLADDDAVSDAVYEDVFSTADNATLLLTSI